MCGNPRAGGPERKRACQRPPNLQLRDRPLTSGGALPVRCSPGPGPSSALYRPSRASSSGEVRIVLSLRPPPPPSQRLYPGRSLRLRRRRERDLSYVTKIGRDGARSEVPWSSQAHPSEQRTATPPRPALGSRGSAPAVQAPGSSSVVLAFAFGTRPQVPPERPSPRPGPRRGTPGPPLTVVGGVRRET